MLSATIVIPASLLVAIIVFVMLRLKQQYDELRESERALKTSEERYRLAAEGANDVIWDWDIRNDRIFFSERGRQMFGFKGEDAVNDFESFRSLIHPEDVNTTLAMLYDYFNGKGTFYKKEMRVKTENGEYVWVLFRGQAIWDEDGRPARMAGSCSDITERKVNEERMNFMAYYDSLTGLPNRTLFIDRLTLALAQAQRKNQKVAIFFLDLDNFKTVNDSLGHSFGDELLKKAGDVLKSCIRKADTIARLGGDEFILMQPQISDVNETFQVAERVLNALQQPWVLNGRDFYITTSIGITLFPDDGQDVQTLLKNADTAMYKAKEGGKNNYRMFTHSMNLQILERMELQSYLRNAMKYDELIIYYQPLVDIRTGKVSGVEALLRWKHPNMGLLLPGRFIPLAEESGVIVPIGEWVLRKACEQNSAWKKAGYGDLILSVNLSARQFQQKNIVEMIQNVLNETGMKPECLELEITESTAVKDLDLTIGVLHKLKEMGTRVSLDDFGTGYSSLNYLKQLPINILKIDKSFVRDLPGDSKEAVIARALITLAHSLSLTVNAEGVETIEQLNFLKNEGCDMSQGYLFSEPLPPSEVENILKQGRIAFDFPGK